MLTVLKMKNRIYDINQKIKMLTVVKRNGWDCFLALSNWVRVMRLMKSKGRKGHHVQHNV
jgi:hypothetical protein